MIVSGPARGRVDFHIHSHASNVTDYYTANLLGIPESYSDPVETYHELRRQGMSLVTLTDHNSIDGVRELLDAGLPGVFISAEMTATFPGDGCNIHVTVANVSEAQFAEVQRLRGNLFEMVAYLDAQIAAEEGAPAANRIAYFMTHPLMSTQNRPYGREGALSVGHIEQAFLLFDCIEVRNGTRTRALNELTHRLVDSLRPSTIARLAEKHGLPPRGRTPWLKAVVAGSDDHGGLNQGRTWTEFPVPADRPPTPNDLIDAMRRRETRPGGAHGGPITLAHAMAKLFYERSDARRREGSRPAASPRARGGATSSVPRGPRLGGASQSLLRFVFDEGALGPGERLALEARIRLARILDRVASRHRTQGRFRDVLAGEARALLADRSFRAALAKEARTDDRVFLVASTLVNRIFQRYAARLAGGDPSNVIGAIENAVALASSNAFASLPYLVAFMAQSSDRLIVRDVHEAFELVEEPRLVLVTDTFFEVNGVAGTIRKMIGEADRRGVAFTVVTCLDDAEREALCRPPEVRRWLESGRLVILPAIVSMAFPGYEGLRVRVPSFLELLRFLQENGFTKMQVSTPGTMGLAGLLAAKVLQIETSSTYHTSFPEYVENYTRDVSLEAVAWNYMIAFYHAVDEVVVPSKFIARLLHARGLRNRKLLVLDRWVDSERFHPGKREARFWDRWGVPEKGVRFLYVGRIGVEKGLSVAADAFRLLLTTHPDSRLLVVGDGPYRAELERRLEGTPATFTGFLEGEELARAFASADVMLFPSTTDTWGNAVLEAQASGLPVVVTDQGGPHELMVDGVTGLKVAGRDVAAFAAAMRLLANDETRRRMGLAAREFVVENRVEEPFSAILDSERYRQRVKRMKKVAVDAESAEPRLEELPLEAYLVDHRMVSAEMPAR
jgi:glycosyltransferase involved in cell wall biosynthesis